MQNQKIENDINSLFSWLNDKKLLINEEQIDNNIKQTNINIIENNDEHNSKSDKKKLKCKMCKKKINLLDELISKCKCGHKYCSKHRMQELHKCTKLDEICIEQRKNLQEQLIKLDSRSLFEKI